MQNNDKIDVQAIRKKTGLSQTQFAAAYHISLDTLKNWEQGRRDPEGPALTLLRLIDRMPEQIREALAPQLSSMLLKAPKP